MTLLRSEGSGEVSTGFYNGVIDQSLRFEDGDAAHLIRTPSSAGDRKTFTISFWTKRANLSTPTPFLFDAYNASTENSFLRFNTDDTLRFSNEIGSSFTSTIVTNQVFRDTANWYHIVLAVDTTQSTASNRVKMYVNGDQITSFSSSDYPSQNENTSFNNTVQHAIGRAIEYSRYYDGYMAEINFIDGSVLTPSSFGETKNGVWIAKKYTGSYGTNGYRLTFADDSSLGDDTSGNGNDYSSSGLASTDVVLDSPENTFCTINSIRESLVYNGSVTFSEGNLQSVDAGTTYSLHWTGTIGMSTGKWYWEVLAHTMGGSHSNIGICNEVHRVATAGTGVFYGGDGKRNAVTYFTGITSYGDSYTSGDIIGIAFDADNETVTFYKNNSSQGAVGSVLVQSSGPYFAAAGDGQNATTYKYVVNFGQDSSFAGSKTAQGNKDGNGEGDFYYTPPSGYLALCSANLPATGLSPNQDEQAGDHFNNVIYTGDGSSSNAITGVGFQPDWVWIKGNGSTNHGLHDSSRVISGNEEIWSTNSTAAGNTGGAYLSSFDSDGFTVNNNTSGNGSGVIHAAWNWKATGGSLTSNSNGSITSNTQANTAAGLSIVTWTGNQTNGASVGHGLGVVPELVIIKNRDDSQGSVVNINLTSKYRVNFNADAANYGDFTYYNGTYTSDNIVFNNAHGAWNGNTDKMVAYVFHSVAGYSRIGTYIGNNVSGNNTFVYTGFRPKFILIKNVGASADWIIRDVFNSGYYTDGRGNPVIIGHEPNEDNALTGGTGTSIDFVSNGFKIRNNDTRIGASNTYFYYAIADNPIKFNNAR